jgi:hypothetical protein
MFAESGARAFRSKGVSSAVAAEFISFGKRQKKRTKEKRFSRQINPMAGSAPGFSDSPSWLGRKTAGILPAALRV